MNTQSVLAGARVTAFTHFAAGPIAAQYLGALGADVIKVESPARDLNRYAVRDPDDSLNGLSPYFLSTNRNQRAIVLDLKSEAGIGVARRLIERSDVVVENFRPGVLDRLGIGYAGARALRPDIIYCSFSAFDATTPARDRPGQDLLMQACSGLATLSGRQSDPPVPIGVYVIDGFTAMQGVIGIVGALLHRLRTGEGQWVRTDMMSTALYMMMHETSYIMNTADEAARSRAGIAHPHQAAPYGVYQTADHGAVVISAFNGVEGVRALAKALRVTEAIAEHLTERGIRTHRDEIAEAFARQIATLTSKQAIDVVTGAGCWAAGVRSVREALEDPIVVATGIVRQFSSSIAGLHRAVTEPLQLSATPLQRDRAAPGYGEHSLEILEELGFAAGAIAELIESGSVRRGEQR